MHKEQKPMFSAPFMKKYGIKGFPVDPKTMDLEDGQFIEELMDSLKDGYDSTKPVLIAKCETDERCDGFVVDGRHRLYCLAKLKEKGVSLPSPFPISYVDVTDANHLRALIAQHEERNRSKSGRFSKAWIDENLAAIIQDKIEEKGADRIGEYIKSLGFTNTAIISKMVDDYSGEPAKKKNSKKKTRPVNGLPEHLQDRWKADTVYAGKDERFDVKISYKPCPDCKNLLKITTDLQGTVLKIELAPSIKN